MTDYKVELNRKTCIGCGACIVQCTNFIKDEDKAKVVNEVISSEDLKSNQEAEECCPVKCITITKIEKEE